MMLVFSYLFDWFMQHAMDPKQYRITITPLTFDAESKLAWYIARDFEHMGWKPGPPTEFRSGIIHGIQFEIGSTP